MQKAQFLSVQRQAGGISSTEVLHENIVKARQNLNISPPKWPRLNQPLLIIASGPSLSLQLDQIELARRKNLKCLVINDNYLKAPWADFLYAADAKWWRWHIDRPELKTFTGRRFIQLNLSSQEQYCEQAQYSVEVGLETIESTKGSTLSINPEIIHQGHNSGFQAINVAYHMGATACYLLGYEMRNNGGKSHWFGDHPEKIKSPYWMFTAAMQELSEHAKKIGFEIINCSANTVLTCFPRKNLEDLL